MASRSTRADTKNTSATDAGGSNWADRASSAAGDLRSAAQGAVDTVAEHGPDVVSATSQTVERTIEGVRTSPTPTLMLGTVFCAGLGIGLLVAGAPRPVVALALGPAVAMGGTLIARRQEVLAPAGDA
jgi:hypothetical protein